MRYASLGTQIFVSLGLAVFAGYKIDHWLNISFPVLVLVLPLAVLCMIMYKLMRETSKKNRNNDQTKN